MANKEEFTTQIDEQAFHNQGQIRFESNGPAINLNYLISKIYSAEKQCVTEIHTKAIIDIFSSNHIILTPDLKLIMGYDSGASHFFRSTRLNVNIKNIIETPNVVLPEDFIEYVCSYVWNIGAKAVMMERGMTEITGKRREWLLPHPSNFLNSFRPDTIGRYSKPPLAVLTIDGFTLDELIKKLLLSVDDPEHKKIISLCIGSYLH